MKKLENEIYRTFLPAIIGRTISEEERNIMALPVRYGGLGIPKPSESCNFEYEASVKITRPLSVMKQSFYSERDNVELFTLKQEVKRAKEELLKSTFDLVYAESSTSLKRALDTARHKGASNWLSTLPIEWLGYSLNKQEFRDSLSLRYNWSIENVPKYYGCGSPTSIDHCLSCKLGGYTIMRHNHLRDTVASIMKEVCHDVKVEPNLIPIDSGQDLTNYRSSREDNARLDVSGRGAWSPFDCTFVDIRVTHPNCLSNRNLPLQQIFRQHEREKKEKYIERVQNVERANFTSFVFMTTGGMGPECLKFINRLGSKISAKKNEQYNQVIRCLRLKLRFALLRSCLIALRGFRGKHYKKDVPISEIAFNILSYTAWAE